jgi:N-acetylglucosamine-6-phosphate deacetylase
MLLRSERIVTPAGAIDGEVLIRDGRIAEVVPRGSGADAVELGERWLIPGFIDTHVHGGGGAQFNTDDPAEVTAVADFHARHGTTTLLATLVAAPPDELASALRAIRVGADRVRSARVAGSHLEGPFLNTARPGAMDPSHFLAPDPAVLDRLLGAAARDGGCGGGGGGGGVRMITIAPELPGAIALIEAAVARGVVVSLGHTEGTYAETEAAARAGARSVTHLFNGMRPLHHRDPGVLGAALDLPQLSCELICDGVHVDPSSVRLAYRAKGPGAVRLITDAMAAAGMPDGAYRLGATEVAVRRGVASNPRTDAIAASTLTMDRAFANAIRFLGISVQDAVVLASTNPARLLGLSHRRGAIAPGMDADLVVLDRDLAPCATLVAGEWATGPPCETPFTAGS